MILLLGIIAFHTLCFYSARYFKRVNFGAVVVIAVFSLLITALLLFGMFTMEQPDTTDQFY